MNSSEPQSSSNRGSRRIWLFRLGAIALGLSVFLAAEGVCWFIGWGRPTDFDDPFVGFSEIHPLFVLDDSGSNYVIPKSRKKFFAAESFPARKGKKTFRIFCLGGSTVQGRPYSTQTAFSTWLQLSLTAADSSRNWDVVNCGGISYASYRLVPILKECLRDYQPDLIVLCSGHNEFLEERTYDHIKHSSDAWSSVQNVFFKSRVFLLMREAVLQTNGSSSKSSKDGLPVMTDDANALLDYKDGIKAYHRDEDWRDGVIVHYENNIRRMIAMSKEADVPLLLIRPTSNLSDCPPFKSQHRNDLNEEELEEWSSLMKAAQSYYRTDLDKSITLLNDALRIDGRYALAWYELGQCYEAKGIRESARKSYRRAREEDICPLRILEPMEQALKEVSDQTGTVLIDAQNLLEEKEPSGILGGYLLVDHIHPSFPGHQLIADAIADEMVKRGWVEPGSGWKKRRKKAYSGHMESLDDLYHLHGQRTLRSLMDWTKGRADGPPIEERTPNGVSTQEKR